MNTFLVALIIFFLVSCGRKLDPTLEDYLEPERVSGLSLSVTDQKVTLSWSYPERERVKIKGFIIEREKNGEKKTLGFFDRNSDSYEDKEVAFGEHYVYSIYAVKPKGVLSKPHRVQVHLTRLPEVGNLKAVVTHLGVHLSWQGEESLVYNIYRINHRGEKVRVSSTKNNFFTDELSSSFMESLRDNFTEEIRYRITTCKTEEQLYMESSGTEVSLSLKAFIPSKPSEVFGTISEDGVLISWKETQESWSIGYRVYRKTPDREDFNLIGETKIPLYVDRDYSLRNLKFPLIYKISSKGPLSESEPAEIKIELIGVELCPGTEVLASSCTNSLE